MKRPILLSIVWGLLVTAVSIAPYLIESSFSDVNAPTVVTWLLGAIGILYLPGLMLSMIFTGNLHDPNMAVAFLLNWGLYATMFHLIRRRRVKHAR